MLQSLIKISGSWSWSRLAPRPNGLLHGETFPPLKIFHMNLPSAIPFGLYSRPAHLKLYIIHWLRPEANSGCSNRPSVRRLWCHRVARFSTVRLLLWLLRNRIIPLSCLFLLAQIPELLVPQSTQARPRTLGSAVKFSLRFNGHSPGEPGLVGVYWSKGWWKWWWQLEL